MFPRAAFKFYKQSMLNSFHKYSMLNLHSKYSMLNALHKYSMLHLHSILKHQNIQQVELSYSHYTACWNIILHTMLTRTLPNQHVECICLLFVVSWQPRVWVWERERQGEREKERERERERERQRGRVCIFFICCIFTYKFLFFLRERERERDRERTLGFFQIAQGRFSSSVEGKGGHSEEI